MKPEILRFHLLSKHHSNRFAPGPGHLDWKNQPNPFREYAGSKLLSLPTPAPTSHFKFRDLFTTDFPGSQFAPRSMMDLASISQFFQNSLGVSSLKRYANGHETVLRINPSSGNLHPTEAYLVFATQEGEDADALLNVAHYNVKHHALEIRKQIKAVPSLMPVPGQTILVMLSSVTWREAWKYGERAFRYCQLDVGHALACLEISAAMLGWDAKVVNCAGGDGLIESAFSLPRGEEPECLVLLSARGKDAHLNVNLLLKRLADAKVETWGVANQLSKHEVEWPGIQRVIEATRLDQHVYPDFSHPPPSPPSAALSAKCYDKDLAQVCHKRRSAVAYDPTRAMPLDTFYSFWGSEVPLSILHSQRIVHFAIFVHNVDGLAPGLYLLVRNAATAENLEKLRAAMSDRGFSWDRPSTCPEHIGHFYCLALGNAQRVAQLVSCDQEIAAESCFSLGMIAAVDGGIEYKRAFWECGMLGQHLYLTAELHEARGTGIGCFLDDSMHDILGLDNTGEFQSLYHFTVGYGLHDSRIVH